jgi:hypothetical protein
MFLYQGAALDLSAGRLHTFPDINARWIVQRWGALIMSTAMQVHTPADWVFKNEAARLLEVTERAVERLARQGVIQRKYLPRRANERQARVVFLKADLQTYRAKGEGPARDPVTKQPNPNLPATANGGPNSQVAQTSYFNGLAEHLAKLSAAYPPPAKEWRLWLTFDEAIDYSGMTPRELRKQIRSGDIVADGTLGSDSLRVSRASLDEYAKVGS